MSEWIKFYFPLLIYNRKETMEDLDEILQQKQNRLLKDVSLLRYQTKKTEGMEGKQEIGLKKAVKKNYE